MLSLIKSNLVSRDSGERDRGDKVECGAGVLKEVKVLKDKK